jgi:glycosyltransferase involved in cell wall biosynthesis
MLRPDVVHLQYQWWLYRGGAMITLLPLFIKTCRKDIMVVTTFHDLMGPYLFPKAGRLRKLGIKLLASFSDRIITSNRRDKEELLRLLPEGKQKISYIPIGAGLFFEERRHPDTAKAYAGLRQGDNQVRIAYFGYLLPYKGIEDLLAAAKLLIERQYPVQLMLIGGFSIDLKKDDAYPLMVQGLAKKLGIWERIKWCGHLRPEEASGYLRAADMCILPYSDGVSERRSSFVAVLSHGIPVITTRCQNTPEALVDRENILLVDPGSPAQIAAAAEALINSPKLRQQLAEASRGLYEERYSWEVIADKTLRVYQKQGT